MCAFQLHILSHFVFSICTKAVMPLDVMVTNDKLEVTSGDPVEIQCKATGGNGGLQVDWLYKDEMLPAQSRQTADGGILSTLKLNPAYAGEFVCLASTLSGESLSVSVSVIVVGKCPSNLHYMLNEHTNTHTHTHSTTSKISSS